MYLFFLYLAILMCYFVGMITGTIKDKFGYYSNHWFVRNVVTLQVGSFTGTVFQAGVGVLLARLLQPELFGIYALAFGLASISGLLLGAGVQDAMSTMLGSAYAQQNRDEVGDVLAFLLKIVIYAAVLTLVLSLFLPMIANYFYGNSVIGWYAGIIVAGVFLSSFFTAAVQLSLQVVGKIRILTLMVFGDQFLRFGTALVLVFTGFGVLGAVTGQFLGSIVLFAVSVFVWLRLQKSYPILPDMKEIFARIKGVSISKYLNFSIWVAIDRNMGNLYMALPVVLAGIYVSTGEVSFFKLAFGFVNLALSLLGPISTLLNIEFPKMKIESADRLGQNFIKVSLYGLLLSTLLTLGAILVSPIAFRILYGDSFAPSIQYVFGLLIYGALFGIGVGLGPMWRAINSVKTSIVINLIVLGIGIPAGLVLIKYFGNWGAVIMVTIWFSVSHLTSFIYLARKLQQLPKN